VAISIPAAIMAFNFWLRYELDIGISSGRHHRLITIRKLRLKNKSKEFITHVKKTIEEAAVARDSNVHYHIDNSEQTITIPNPEGSPIIIGDSGTINHANAQNSPRANIRQASDTDTARASQILELIRIIEQETNGERRDFLKLQLEIVRAHLEGKHQDKPNKTEAGAALWKFAQNVGELAKSGSRVFELARHIAHALS
jgi:hypothetical protein